MYIATRGLYGLKPPTVFVPPSIKEDVEKLLDVHRSMSQVELNLDLIALDVGKYSVFFTYFASPLVFISPHVKCICNFELRGNI